MHTIVAPIERAKLLLQTQESNLAIVASGRRRFKGMLYCIIRMVREEGILSLWRGNGSSVLRYYLSVALNFSLKDLGDARRVDRWTENLSTRPFGETRRGTSDRWNDSSNRETNFDQRRESKWNTRWGPDDKESEGLREKWSDSVKEGDLHLDKGLRGIKVEVLVWNHFFQKG